MSEFVVTTMHTLDRCKDNDARLGDYLRSSGVTDEDIRAVSSGNRRVVLALIALERWCRESKKNQRGSQ